MKPSRRTTPRRPGSSHPIQIAGVVALLVVLAAALAVAGATGKL